MLTEPITIPAGLSAERLAKHPEAAHALAKIAKEAAEMSRDLLTVGRHVLDCEITVTLAGVLGVGKDGKAKCPAKVNNEKALLLALAHMNDATRRVVVDKIIAMANGEELDSDTQARLDRVAAELEAAKTKLRQGAEVDRKGQVRWK